MMRSPISVPMIAVRGSSADMGSAGVVPRGERGSSSGTRSELTQTRLDQPRLVGEHHGLDAVTQFQLVQEMGDVRLHRGLAEKEAHGDLAVAEAPGDEQQDLTLTFGELAKVRRVRVRSVTAEPLDQPPRDRGCEQRVTRRGDPHGANDVVAGRVLEQESRRPRAERLKHVLVEVEGGQDHDPRRTASCGDATRRLEAVENWHADIHQDDVRAQCRHRRDPFLTVRSVAHYLDVGFLVEEGAQAGAHQWLIVDQQDANHVISGSRGSRAVTLKPSLVLPARNSPWSMATRSRMPVRPEPSPEGVRPLCPLSVTLTVRSSVP